MKYDLFYLTIIKLEKTSPKYISKYLIRYALAKNHLMYDQPNPVNHKPLNVELQIDVAWHFFLAGVFSLSPISILIR